MLEEIKEYFVEKTGCSLEKLNENLELSELGIDSLKLLMIVEEFEEKFDISITDEELLRLHTFNDLVDLVMSKHE